MRFSVWPSFQRPWSEVLDLARHVESDGWHGLWFADHYMADTPDGSPSDDPALECWTALAALAAAVPRLQLGSLVSPSSVHHPALLAKQATTVDQVAGGRVVLGVGAGWQVNEHRAYGFELLPPKERVDRFAELIQVLRGLLHDQRTTFHGRWFTVEDAPCQPKGADGPIPIMVGTPSPRMLRLTARWADVWNGWGTPQAIRAKVAALDAACEAEGSRPGHGPAHRAGAVPPHRRPWRGRGGPAARRRPTGWWPARRPSWSTRWASTPRPGSTSSSSPTSPWAAPRPSASSPTTGSGPRWPPRTGRWVGAAVRQHRGRTGPR